MVAVLIAAGLLCVLPARAATTGVSLQDNTFKPSSVTVRVGDQVTWTHNDGAAPHSVTADAGQDESWDSSPTCRAIAGCMTGGDTFTHKFTHSGTFTYYCRVHGSQDPCTGMCGRVVVIGSTSPSPEPTASVRATQGPGGTESPTRTAPPGALAPVPLTATPLALPSLTAPPAPAQSVRPFGTPQAVKKTSSPKGRAPVTGLAIAAVLLSTGAAVATYVRFGRPPF